MGKNRLFFPQEALDRWLVSRVADLSGDQLWLRESGQRLRLVEGLRVLNEVSGAEDPFDVCGTARTVEFLLGLGAELLGDSMIISENAYQIAPGWLATPIQGSAELPLGAAPPLEKADNIDQRLSLFLARNA